MSLCVRVCKLTSTTSTPWSGRIIGMDTSILLSSVHQRLSCIFNLLPLFHQFPRNGEEDFLDAYNDGQSARAGGGNLYRPLR